MRQLKNRLYTVSTLVPRGARVADIGTDHGHLPIFLIKEGICPTCLACDIKEKPLANARENIEKTGTPNIETRLGAGLDPILPNEVDCITIAGMGGEVIALILEAAPWVRDKKYTLILQPMTSADTLRKYLCEKGFSIESETACEENRKIYSVLKVAFSGEYFTPDEFFCRVGKLLPNTDAAVKYIEKQLRVVKDCIDDRTAANLDAVSQKNLYVQLLNLLQSGAS